MLNRSFKYTLLVSFSVLSLGLSFIWIPAQSDEVASPQIQSVNDASTPIRQDAADVQKSERRNFMRGKLAMVQKVVAGITTEDFEMIEKGCMELAALSESAVWQSTQDPFYGQYSSNFEFAIKGLLAAAKSESVEKSTFAYVHVMISCTACHQHVRGTVRTAK